MTTQDGKAEDLSARLKARKVIAPLNLNEILSASQPAQVSEAPIAEVTLATARERGEPPALQGARSIVQLPPRAPALANRKVNIEDALWRRVKIHAATEGHTIKDIVTAALLQYLGH